MILLVSALLFVVLGVPVAGAVACQLAVQRRETVQRQIADGVSHLKPRHTWSVAYASAAHMEGLFKLFSWEDVGVLHVYEDAVAFYGQTHDFEVERDQLTSLRLTTFVRTNPLIPWIELETQGGSRYYFCVPRGVHVFGMQDRASSVCSALEAWLRGSSRSPLRIS